MALQKLSSTDAFVVTDLDGAEQADGVVRWAKKVLVDGARTMARSRTYSWALLEERISGASAGINAAPDDRATAVAAFVTELTDRVASGALALDPGKGLGADDLAPLRAVDGRSPLLATGVPLGTVADDLLAEGVAAAAGAALGDGGLDGRTVSIEGAGAAGPAIVAAFAARGARTVAIGTPSGTALAGDRDAADLAAAWLEHGDALPADLGDPMPPAAVLTEAADVLVCGSKLGLVDHDVAATLPHRVLAPCGVAPVTARGLAVAGRGGVVVLPDFLTLLGPLLAFRAPESAELEALRTDVAARVGGLVAAVADHDEGPYLGAALRAEEFLRSWQDQLPFGRPLA